MNKLFIRKVVKSSYHFLAAFLILYIIFKIIKSHFILKSLLFLIAVFHLYDVWWFLNNDGNAPI